MAEAENPQRLIALLRGLRAGRQFRPDPVPQEVVDGVLEVARWSGSAGNQQPWELVVIRKRETLQALAKVEGYAGHLAGAAFGIVLVMNGEPGQVDLETFDEGRLSERMMLAAAAYGAGSASAGSRGREGWLLKRCWGFRRKNWFALRFPLGTRMKRRGALVRSVRRHAGP